MRELPGVNELHKSNTDYNKNVVHVIKAATQASNTRDFIDILGQSKKIEDVTRYTEDNIPELVEDEER
ncbi:MAG: hypothetical protein K2H53_07090 [Clostridia bacterium]|nr:hypothetical protein [Clostridia bacterium]